MKIFGVFLSFILLSSAFLHHGPSESCTVNNLPNDATPSNTYDYIFIGSGATSTITAAKLARDLACDVSILIVEAGRSYTGDPEPDCTDEVDCYIKHVENKYHEYGSAFPIEVLSTRSTWSFVTREQVFSKAIAFSDGRDPGDCPIELTNPTVIPGGCACLSDIIIGLAPALCTYSTDCLANNGQNETLCGEPVCGPELCAKPAVNLYHRSSAKGGSNAHHAMVNYKQSPYVAQKWVENTGDPRFSWTNWERVYKEWAIEGGGGMSFVNNPQHPYATSANDTWKALFREGALQHGRIDLTNGFQPTNIEEFFDATNPEQDYFKGFVSDTVVGHHSRASDGTRSFPDDLLNDVMAECPSSLDVLCGAFGTKVIFADQGSTLSRTAIGVEYIDGYNNFGLDFNFDKAEVEAKLLNPKKAYARKGVILGGGTFNSPQTLMLSGIGDQTELENFGIPIRKHVPAVGKNMLDDTENSLHYTVTANGDPFAANSPIWPGFADKDVFVPDIIKRFFGFTADIFDNTTGTPLGPPPSTNTMCHTDAPVYGGRACPTIPNSNTTIPDDPVYLASLKGEISWYNEAVFASTVSTVTLFRNEVDEMMRKNPNCMALCAPGYMLNGWYDGRFNYGGAFGSTMICDVLNSDLQSRGTVSLQSANPFDPLIIDPNTFSVDSDVDEVAKCVNQMRQIMDNMNTISAANATTYAGMAVTEYPSSPWAPGPSVSKTEITPELRDYVRESLWHHHPQGTNRMGNVNDANSVVDSRGRVWGTQNLYVIDVSTNSFPVDFFPSSSAIALGWLQAESLTLHHASDSHSCNTNQFLGAQPREQFDASSDPFKTWTIILAIASGILLIVVIVLIAMRYMRVRRPGYTPMNNARVQGKSKYNYRRKK